MYEAVIGYTEDAEVATWGAGETADAAIRDAVERFVVDAHDCIEPGDYEVTVYAEPLTRERPDGDGEVYAWLDRGTCTVTVEAVTPGPEHMRIDWSHGPVAWVNVAVKP